LVLCHFFFSMFLFSCLSLFFFNDTATTEIYTLSLHDALPICKKLDNFQGAVALTARASGLLPCWKSLQLSRPLQPFKPRLWPIPDRKSTRLNSSHDQISYAVFCLKKKKTKNTKY